MKLPDTDDLVLFGSLALAALGNFLITVSVTGDWVLASGTALVVFGILSAIIAFMAAGQETK